MNNKPNLLVVGNYNRRDFLDIFYACKQEFNFYFIEYASPAEIIDTYYQDFGKALFWKDFDNAFDLINKIKPVKVIFFFIESFNHVALNVACKESGIKTFHLEHGLRLYDVLTAIVKAHEPPAPDKISRNFNWLLSTVTDLFVKIKNKLFLYRTIKKLNGPSRLFLKQYYKIRKTNTVFETFQIINSPYRVADTYISFSPNIFKFHQIVDHLKENQQVHYIGFPGFDHWAYLEPAVSEPETIIFIDQPFVKQGLLGWTEEFQTQFVSNLINVCKEAGYKLQVKLHPFDSSRFWFDAAEQHTIEIISNADFDLKVSRAEIIIGFYSTLLMPLAALPHITLFTLENHPLPNVFPSKFLVESGVSQPVFALTELGNFLLNKEAIKKRQAMSKEKFIEDWLFKFDGKAGERLREILLTN